VCNIAKDVLKFGVHKLNPLDVSQTALVTRPTAVCL
jgi:hypothetical protein